nr:MAG TPA: hypothetical protein [Bacteriophage sp.]
MLICMISSRLNSKESHIKAKYQHTSLISRFKCSASNCFSWKIHFLSMSLSSPTLPDKPSAALRTPPNSISGVSPQ